MKNIDIKILFNILFFVVVFFFSLDFKSNLEKFDKQYLYLNNQSYLLELKTHNITDILKDKIISLKYNNDIISNHLTEHGLFINSLLKERDLFKGY